MGFGGVSRRARPVTAPRGPARGADGGFPKGHAWANLGSHKGLPLSLNNTIIGVTGAGGHLGAAMTLELAAHGATVLALGRNQESLDAVVERASALETDGGVIALVCDILSEEDIGMALDCMEGEGGVHGWVNNAFGATGSQLDELDSESVSQTLDCGLGAVMLLTDQVAARMSDGGAIVNVASMYGVVSPQPSLYADHPQFHNPPAYGAAKAGLIQYTRYAATHWAPRGIRVNAISPGAFPSETVAQTPGFVEALEARIPLGRVGDPHEVARCVRFLLSEDASYITGHNLAVDGGWTSW